MRHRPTAPSTIWMGTQGMGQGLETSFTQLASELLGVDPSKIKIAMGDSDRVGGVGSMGSRSAYIGGSAVLSGSEKLVDKGKELAADALEASTADIDYAAGRFTITGTDRGIGLGELAAKQPDKRIFIENENTSGTSLGLAEQRPMSGEVEHRSTIPARSKFEAATTTVDDVGRPLHRPIVFGQIQWRRGAGHRPGAAGRERLRPPTQGQLITGSFMDYAIAAGRDLPDLQQPARRDSVPAKSNPIARQGRQ